MAYTPPLNPQPTSQNDTNITGTLSTTDVLAPVPTGNGVLINTAPTAGSFVAALVPGGTAQCDIQITGTATGTYYFEASMDSTTGSDGNWTATNYRQTGITNTVLGYQTITMGVYRGAPSGFKYIRVRNVGGTTPTNGLVFRYSGGGDTVFLNASIPAGANSIGKTATDQTTNIIAPTIMQNAAVAVGNGVNLNVQGYSTAIITVSGTMSAGTTITFKESTNDVVFNPIAAHQLGVSGNLSTTTTTTGEYRISCAGLKSLQAVITTYGAGTVTATGFVSVFSGHSTTVNANIIAALPAGAATIGSVGIIGTVPISLATAPTTPVTGAFFQTTQPVSIATAPTTPVTGTFFQTTQPISATTLPLPTGAALDATLTGGTQVSRLSDGTNTVNVLKSDGTAAGQNSQMVAGTGYTTTTLSLNSTTLNTAWFDMLNYSEMSFEILTNTGPATLTPQMSGDASQTNITIATMQQVGQTQSVSSANSTNATYRVTRGGRYFRLSSNATGAQTVTVVFTFYSLAAGTLNNGSAQSGTWNVGITDGTNNVNVLKADGTAAGQNSQLVAGAFLEKTTALSALGNFFSTDVSNYSFVSVQITGAYVGTVVFEASNDNVNWSSSFLRNPGFNGVNNASNFTTVNSQFVGALELRYYRVRMSAYTSGTATVTAELTALNRAPQTNISFVTPNSPTGSATPANAFLLGASNGTNLQALLVDGANNLKVNVSASGVQTVSQATAANLNTTAQVTDGTNVANVLKADGTSAGQNSQLVSQTDLVSNGTITTQNLNLNTGVATAGSFVGPLTLSGSSMVGIQLSGTYTGQIIPQVSNDGGNNWVTLSPSGAFYKKSNGTSVGTLTAESGFFQIAIAGAGLFRLTMSNAPSGSAIIQMRSTNASNVVTVGAPLPAGTFQIGNVGQGGTWSVGSNSATGATVPANAHLIGLNSGGLLVGLSSNSQLGDNTAAALAVQQYVSSGGNFSDRVRGNETVTLLASAARTVTATSADLVSYNGVGYMDVILDMTVVGTGSVTVTINGKDPASGKYYPLLAGAAVITNVTNVYTLNPHLATAVANVSAQKAIPRVFQIVVTANNANTATYSVGYNLMRG